MEIQLLKKGYSTEEVQKTIKWLQRRRYLDDKLWAEAYLRSEVAKKWKPLPLIKAKLLQKGIGKQIVETLIDQMRQELVEGQKNKIQDLVKKYKAKWLDGFEILQKLTQKGYDRNFLQSIFE